MKQSSERHDAPFLSARGLDGLAGAFRAAQRGIPGTEAGRAGNRLEKWARSGPEPDYDTR